MTLDVRERFLEDAPQLLLHLPRQATIRTYGIELRVDARTVGPPLEVRLRERDEALLLGDLDEVVDGGAMDAGNAQFAAADSGHLRRGQSAAGAGCGAELFTSEAKAQVSLP